MDWFRKKSWTKKDEEHFFAKLNRARKWGRPQYLRIQAVELIMTKKPDLLKVAESLLIKMLDEYPDEQSERSLAFIDYNMSCQKLLNIIKNRWISNKNTPM